MRRRPPRSTRTDTLFPYTTLFRSIVQPSSGSVTFNGHALTGLKPFAVSRLGVGRTFQVARAFARLTVLENVLVAALSSESNDRRARGRAHAALEQVRLDA